ncbi:hypothetical protein [Micromonospora coxensis]|uniref:hypothetical protein n=1 Tax=Micromonospora coxensis TaxID=356852 RepID=UPI00343F1FF5
MPAHSVLATVTLVIAGVAAVGALGYAWVRPLRRTVRWPLLVTATAATVLAFMTAAAGSELLRDVEAAASTAEAAAARAHGHSADGFATAVVCLLVGVLATVWSVLRPNRERWSAGMWTGALVLTVAAVATLVTGGQVLAAALDALALRTAV